MATQGSATIDFGAGASMAQVDVTGQAGILSTSQCEAWVQAPVAGSASHSHDEHLVESLDLRTGNVVAGTGFTIYAVCEIGTAQGQFTVQWVWA